MADLREIRVITTELRKVERGAGAAVLSGRAIVYNRLSEDLGGFREMFAPGSLADSLAVQEVASFWQHDPAYVLGRTSNNTLHLEDGDEGLDFVVEPPDTTWARDAMVSVERGDVHQMSFGWSPEPDGDEWRMLDGEVLRIVRRAKLYEISPVTMPAYPQTSVELQKRAAELRAQTTADGGQRTGEEPGTGERALLADLERRRMKIAILEVER